MAHLASLPLVALAFALLTANAAGSMLTDAPQLHDDSPQRDAGLEVLNAGDAGLLITVNSVPEQARQVRLSYRLDEPVSAGQHLRLRFRFRAADPNFDEERHELVLTAALENADGTRRSSAQRITGRERWREVDLSFAAAHDHAAGQGRLVIDLGHQAQIVELRDVRLGPADDPATGSPAGRSYEGRDPDAPWRAEAQQRIEQHRMAELTVHVVDGDGQPVPGAQVAVEMTRHAFTWGTAVSAAELAGEPRNEGDRITRQTIRDHFNAVVLGNDFKLTRYGWLNDNVPPRVRQAYDWIQEHEIELKGHWIFIPTLRGVARGQEPEIQAHYDRGQEAFLDWYKHHIRERLGAYPGLLAWDVNNHAGRWEPEQEQLTLASQVELMRYARELEPDSSMYVNENFILAGSEGYNRWDLYENRIEALIERDAPFDGIGFMAHFGGDHLYSKGMPELWSRLEHYAGYGKKLAITEWDIKDGDPDIRRDFIRDFVTLCFSHPQMEHFFIWGMQDDRHWKQDAILYDSDWRLKPGGAVFLDLISNQWWTDESGVTDEQGRYRLRGFLGQYRISVEHEGHTDVVDTTLTNQGHTVTVTLP